VKETVMRAEAYSTRDRHNKKREFRSLWIIRINAAARSRGLSYSQLIRAFKTANILLNRKQLSELAIQDEPAFNQLIEAAVGKVPATAAK
jgi:large subunit ribosomal protein L20